MAEAMLTRLQMRLLDPDDIPPMWTDIIYYHGLGLKEREIDQINRRNNGGDYAHGGGMMSKQKKMEIFKREAAKQAARAEAKQRAREGLSGAGAGEGGDKG